MKTLQESLFDKDLEKRRFEGPISDFVNLDAVLIDPLKKKFNLKEYDNVSKVNLKSDKPIRFLVADSRRYEKVLGAMGSNYYFYWAPNPNKPDINICLRVFISIISDDNQTWTSQGKKFKVEPNVCYIKNLCFLVNGIETHYTFGDEYKWDTPKNVERGKLTYENVRDFEKLFTTILNDFYNTADNNIDLMTDELNDNINFKQLVNITVIKNKLSNLINKIKKIQR